MSSSHDITLTPQEQALIMRLKVFPCSRNGTYPGRTVEDPNADLNTHDSNG